MPWSTGGTARKTRPSSNADEQLLHAIDNLLPVSRVPSGLQADKEALAHIVYNLEGGDAGEVDTAMVDALRPSIEEAEPIETQDMALDYIGKRGAQVHAVL